MLYKLQYCSIYEWPLTLTAYFVGNALARNDFSHSGLEHYEVAPDQLLDESSKNFLGFRSPTRSCTFSEINGCKQGFKDCCLRTIYSVWSCKIYLVWLKSVSKLNLHYACSEFVSSVVHWDSKREYTLYLFSDFDSEHTVIQPSFVNIGI